MNTERKYYLMTLKHTTLDKPLFWGSRTSDDEPRSFGGYTYKPWEAEVYSMQEIEEEFGDPKALVNVLPLKTIFGKVSRFDEYNWNVHDNSSDLFITTLDEIPM